MTTGESLLAEGAAVLAAVESYIKRSEARASYRRERGRDLSHQHKEALAELMAALDVLRDRLTAILVTPEELRQRFEDLTGRLAALETEDEDR